MEVPNKYIPSPDTRRYIYGVLMAVGAALVALNVLSQDVWVHLANIVGAVLVTGGFGLARGNTPDSEYGAPYDGIEDDADLPLT